MAFEPTFTTETASLPAAGSPPTMFLRSINKHNKLQNLDRYIRYDKDDEMKCLSIVLVIKIEGPIYHLSSPMGKEHLWCLSGGYLFSSGAASGWWPTQRDVARLSRSHRSRRRCLPLPDPTSSNPVETHQSSMRRCCLMCFFSHHSGSVEGQ